MQSDRRTATFASSKKLVVIAFDNSGSLVGPGAGVSGPRRSSLLFWAVYFRNGVGKDFERLVIDDHVEEAREVWTWNGAQSREMCEGHCRVRTNFSKVEFSLVSKVNEAFHPLFS